jgi:hypothetical protein
LIESIRRSPRITHTDRRRPTRVSLGPPGIDKSAVVARVAAALGVALEDIRALLLDPVDLRGLPFVAPDGLWSARGNIV